MRVREREGEREREREREIMKNLLDNTNLGTHHMKPTLHPERLPGHSWRKSIEEQEERGEKILLRPFAATIRVS